jgi:hypothetical protein
VTTGARASQTSIMIRTSLVFAATFTTLATAACAGRILDAGTLDTTADGGAIAASVAVSGDCTASSCSNQQLSCSSGAAPVNLTCAPHATTGATSIFDGTCVLAGECPDDAGTLSCATRPLPITACTSSGPCVGVMAAGGYGLVSVEVDAPAAGTASRTWSAFFTDGSYDIANDMTFGSCIYDVNGLDLSESGTQGPAPNPGVITVSSGAAADTLNPACDGTYADTQLPGALADDTFLDFAWTLPSGNPYDFPAPYGQLSTPHSITLSAGDSLDAAAPTLSRSVDTELAWTTSGTPLELEQVVVQLVQGKASVTCSYPTSAGAGTIPSDALLQLGSGVTSYGVYAQHEYPPTDDQEPGAGNWVVTFRARTVARTSSGLAKGDLTLR